MSLNYGSSLTTTKLSREDIGFEPTKQQVETIISIFRTIITLVAIGVAFIPGIDLVAETLVAVTDSALQETLDFVSGNANVANTLINFSTPLVGAYSTARINRAVVSRVLEGGSNAEEYIGSLVKAGLREDEIATQLIKAGIITDVKELNKVSNIASIIKNANISRFSMANKGLRLVENKTLNSIGMSRTEVRFYLEKMRKDYKLLGNMNRSFTESYKAQQRILRTIGFDEKEVKDFLKTINSLTLSPEQKFSSTLGFIREAQVLTNDRYKYKAFVKALGKGEIALNEAWQIPMARQLTRLSDKAFPQQALYAGRKEAKDNANRMLRALRNPGSTQFNDYVVQPLQAVFDANDAGRAPVEALYKVIKKSFNKDASKAIQTLKKAKTLEDAFVKAGGVLVDSDWHLGYKKITSNVGVPNLTQISYGKDRGIIREVYVFATDSQLESYLSDPGSYYLNHWAYSKGGAKLNLGGAFGKTFSKESVRSISGVLSFIPTPMLRNIFSIVSNVVENAWDMHDGKWSKEWNKKFKGSFERASLNRSFRLATRVVGGRIAGRYLGEEIGATIGRELQRVGTNIVVPIIRFNMANNARLKAGKKPLKRPFTRTQIINKGLMGVTANVRRVVRQRRGQSSVILNTLSAQRVEKQINRAPNTFTRGRKYRGGYLQYHKPPKPRKK